MKLILSFHKYEGSHSNLLLLWGPSNCGSLCMRNKGTLMALL